MSAFRRNLLAEPFPKEWEAWLSANMALYPLLSDTARARLHDDARILIAEKHWEGCDGLKVTEQMKVTVAAQAALLLLGLEHDYFSRVRSIVLFPTAFETPAESWEERGRTLLGQAVDYGTVFLSWETVLAEARNPTIGRNLVIHEFTHQLDFLDGYTNGVPALGNREQTRRWQRVMQGTFQRLRRDLQMGRRTFLGSYAATNSTEFFSVSSEKFFSLPGQLRQTHPELFAVLAEYYRVDPRRWFEGKPGVDMQPDAEERTTDETEVEPPAATTESDFIDFTCPYCHNPLSFPKPDVGTLKQCPNCVESMIVPASGSTAEPIPFPIRTARLVLRRLQALDAKDLAGFTANADVLRYLDWNPMTLEEVEDWIAGQRRVRFPQSDVYSYMAIEEIQTGRVIGVATFWFPHKDFDLLQFDVIIHPNWQRTGYATEAIRGLLAYAFKGLRLRRIIAQCDSRNNPARRLLLKAGLRQEGDCVQDRFVKGEWVNTLGFALLRQEYESERSGAWSVARPAESLNS